MAANIVTECPACTTRFQVTQGQLKIANGKVRCGSCLEVFNAEVYRCDDLSSPMEASEQSHKDPLFDQIEVPAFAPPRRSPTGFDKRYVIPEEEPLVADQLNSEPDDERSVELEQPVQELINTEDINDQQSSPVQTTALKANLSVTDIAVDTSTLSSEDGALQQSIETRSDNSSVPPTDVHNKEQSNIALSASDTTDDRAASDTVDKPAELPLSPVTDFRPEPVVIKATREEPASWAGWTICTLLAGLLLASQFMWFNRQQLSVYPELASIYTLACKHLPCHLKTPLALELIKTQQLVVHPQKDYQGALSVTLLLENKAAFNQPFPAIQLSFSDRRGQLISQRIIQPTEYLKNSKTVPIDMPARTPVKVSFDILDPGRRALSYEAILTIPASIH
ncbi:DUF3426 domain-containing protein [Amphritea japonica]|uniref:Zinc finger/thioredoxin putative domain-containing protein n=1 Tax=Amphritea japonica ATCC BAA-1530 TaxID=1278309 RepID=A0A7R6SU33_9GAMM|nr:DUF3426 domain-containing protein [Amphritea japonica]BBB27330.1 hypothetical protein AMJAP_2744 [Amphritea japonica ATCC BAA-1530]